MLRAVALAAARLGPRQGRRLLSAATQAVPTPNQQPEVLYNQVRPPPCFVLCRVGRDWICSGLSLPRWVSTGLLTVALSTQLPFLPREQFGPLSASDTSAP